MVKRLSLSVKPRTLLSMNASAQVSKRIHFYVKTQQGPYRNDRNHEKQGVVLLELYEDTYKCSYEKVRT